MAWAELITTSKKSTNGTSVTTDAIDTTGAELIVVCYHGHLTVTITDSASNTNWYESQRRPNTGGYGLIMKFIPNPTTSASHTFTASGGSTFPTLAILAFTGAFGGAELVTTNHATPSQTVAPGSITPGTNDALLVTMYGDSATTGTRSINASFSLDETQTGDANAATIAAAHLIQTSATAANPTWTTTASATDVFAIMQSFLLQSAGGGGEHSFPF
jgi:hypothetical protein